MAESVQVATLRHALALAGSVFDLARKISLGARSLTAMLDGTEEIPSWVFLRLADYINDEQERPYQQHPFDPDRIEPPKTPQE